LFGKLFLFFLVISSFLPESSRAQLNAKFSFVRSKTCIKTSSDAVVVTFRDETTGGAHLTQWAFGDGGSSTNPNPTWTYTSAGVYYVTLTVVNAANETSFFTALVVIFPEQVVKFTADVTSGCLPLTVNLTDQTKDLEVKDPLTGNIFKEFISTRKWTFGDGTSAATGQAGISHVYTKSGNMDVGLTVVSEGGCSVFQPSPKGYITVFDPGIADFYLPPPSSCQYPVTIKALNNSTGVNQYKWTVTGPSAVTISNDADAEPDLTFPTPGTYIIKLATTTANGCKDEKTSDYFLPPTTIKASFTGPDSACSGTSLNFLNTSNPDPITNQWFINGNLIATQKDLNYTFTNAGQFTVRLQTQIGACLAFTEKTIRINPAPVADFSVDKISSCNFPFPVVFTDNSSGSIVKRVWNFGDGNSITQNSPYSPVLSHIYTRDGIFSVGLTLTSDKGCIVSKTVPNQISIVPPKIVKVNLPDSGCLPFKIAPVIQFANMAELVNWEWEYKDRKGNVLATENTPVPAPYTLTDSGQYTVNLRVTTTEGCQKTYNWIVRAGSKPKDFDFVALPRDSCASESFNFKYVQLFPDSITGYKWVFDAKDSINEKDPKWRFKKIEPVDVKLVVYQYGCSNELFKKDYINVRGVVSIFSVLDDCSAPFERVIVDNSLGNIQNWDLNYGDGNINSYTSKQNSLQHKYDKPGQYTISLKVSDGTCSYIDSLVVRVVDEGKIDFSFLKMPLCVSDTFMTINAVADNPKFIKSYNWDLGCGFGGPGGSSTLKVNFASLCKYGSNGGRGVYSIQLRIIDTNNCVISSPRKNVLVGGPVANYAALTPVTGCSGLPVTFRDNTSGDGTTPFVSKIWSFGDGTTPVNILSGPVTHQFNGVGQFPVTLTVTDTAGCTSSKTNTTVLTSDPDIRIVSFDTISCFNKNIQLEAISSSQLVSYAWLLGDGKTAFVPNPRVSYQEIGLKTIQVTVKDLLGCEKTAINPNFIYIDTPSAKFSAFKEISECPPFNALFTFNGNYAESFEWDFGDGTSSTLKDPEHLYNLSGNYPVSLTVTSPGGCKVTSYSPLLISVKGPRGSTNFKPAICDPYDAVFNINHVNTNFVFIDYGDGNVSDTMPVASQYTYRYSDTGFYQPKIFLLNTVGCSVFIPSPNGIRTVAIEPKFTPDINFMCDFGTVTFTDRSLTNEPLTAWRWDFGDGKTGSGRNPVTTYTKPGLYNVKLNVTSQNGCLDSLTRSAIIEVQARPDIGIQSSKAVLCEEDIIQFKGIELTPNNSPVVSWFWDFTNGNSATGQIPPLQQFRKAGIYPFRLYATNGKGCSDSLDQNFVVHPNPLIDAGPDVILCQGKPVQLSAKGANTYQWQPASFISCLTCPDPIISPASDITYIVKGFSSLGCTSTDSLNVKVVFPSKVSAMKDTFVCAGESIQLFSFGSDIYKWSPSAGLNRTDIAGPTARPAQTTVYTVTGRDPYNCFVTTDDVLVRVVDLPKVDAGKDTTVMAGYPFALRPTYSNDVTRVQWVPTAFLNCPTCKVPTSTPSYSTTYTLFAYTDEGCMSKDVLNVFVTCTKENLFIPNTFSPNGDGQNEIFYPRGRGIEKIKSMKLFSRWGQLVYEKQNFFANDQSAGWNGKRAGQFVTPDVYVYMIELVCENGNIITLKGDVTLIR